MHRLLGGEAQVQSFRRGQADVLHRHADEPARDVVRVLPRGQHAAQPVERRVRVGVAHGFVKRRDQVIVLLAALVIEQDALLQRLRSDLASEQVLIASAQQCRCGFKRVQGVARVAAGEVRHREECVLIGLQVE